MRFHDLSDHFVLVGQFGLQIGDLLFQVAAASVSKLVAALLESRGSLLEENLLPLVKLGGLDAILVTDLRKGYFFNQVPPQNLDFLLGRKIPAISFHGHSLSKITEINEISGNVQFRLNHRTVLLGSSNEEDYGPYADALINAVNAPNISITGGGEINGNASSFMKELRPGGDIYIPKWGTHKGCPGSRGTTKRRYMLMTLVKCDHLKITEITLKDAASWFIHPVGCDDVLIESVSIIGDLRVPNNDGIDPDHCRNVRISNCYVHTGDDASSLRIRFSAIIGPILDHVRT
jgi:hypothetical protein